MLLVFNIAHKPSFDNLDHWYEEIKNQSEPDAFIVLVGNQSDREIERKVSVEKAQKYKAEKNLDMYLESSAKTSHNVEEVFTLTAKMLYKKFREKILEKKNFAGSGNERKETKHKIKIEGIEGESAGNKK